MKNNNEITQESAEEALNFLAEYDEAFGEVQTAVKATLFLAEQERYKIYLTSDGKNVEERKGKAFIAKEFKQKMDNYYKADKEMRTLQAQRKTAELTIDLWRSINAARRAGG